MPVLRVKDGRGDREVPEIYLILKINCFHYDLTTQVLMIFCLFLAAS